MAIGWTGERAARALINLQRKTIHILRRLLDESDTTNTWGIDLNSHGSNTAPALLRAEYPVAIVKLRYVMKEAVAAGHVFNSHIPVDVEIRQRQWQQCERSDCARQAQGHLWRALSNKVHHGKVGGLHPTHGGTGGKIGTRRKLNVSEKIFRLSGFRLRKKVISTQV